MNKTILKTMLKPLVPKLGSWLHGLELKEGERQAMIMLDIYEGNLIIRIVAIRINESGKPEVVRIIETMRGEDLI